MLTHVVPSTDSSCRDSERGRWFGKQNCAHGGCPSWIPACMNQHLGCNCRTDCAKGLTVVTGPISESSLVSVRSGRGLLLEVAGFSDQAEEANLLEILGALLQE